MMNDSHGSYGSSRPGTEIQLNAGLYKLPASNSRWIKIRPTAERGNRVIGLLGLMIIYNNNIRTC